MGEALRVRAVAHHQRGAEVGRGIRSLRSQKVAKIPAVPRSGAQSSVLFPPTEVRGGGGGTEENAVPVVTATSMLKLKQKQLQVAAREEGPGRTGGKRRSRLQGRPRIPSEGLGRGSRWSP